MELKKRGNLIGVFIVLLLLIQITSAVETEITIKTLPDHEVQLTTHKANIANFVIIEKFKNNSNIKNGIKNYLIER